MKSTFLILLFLISSFMVSACSSQNGSSKLPSLIPYRKGNLWGYSDKNRKIVIPCKYNTVDFFDTHGLAVVTNKKSEGIFFSGIIDSLGNWVVPIKYGFEQFSYQVIKYDGGREDKFGVFDSYKWNNYLVVITNFGSEDIQDDLKSQRCFINYEINASGEEIKVAFNRDGKRILNDSFNFIQSYPLNEMSKYILARNKFDSKVRIYNLDGIVASPLTFDQIRPITETMYICETKNEGQGIFKITGEKIIFGRYGFREIIGNNIATDISDEGENYFNIIKMRFVGTTSPKSRIRYKFTPNFIVVPFNKSSEDNTYKILNNDLSELVEGTYKFISFDSIYKNLYLYNNNKITCCNYNGDIKFSIADIDTILSISHTSYFIRKNKLFGVWSSIKKDYTIQPNFKYINYTLSSYFVLMDMQNKYIVMDSNGVFLTNDKFKKVSLHFEEINCITDKFRNIRNIADPIFISPPIRYYTGLENNNAIKFQLLTKSISSGIYNIYNKENYFQILNEFTASICSFLLENEDGSTSILNGDGKFLKLDKGKRFSFKTENLVFYQNILNDKFYHCINMNAHELPSISFSAAKSTFVKNGLVSIVVSKYEKSNSNILQEKLGIIDKNGNVVEPIIYKDIIISDSFYIRFDGIRSEVFSFSSNNPVCKSIVGSQIIKWFGDWGIVIENNKKSHSQGVINKNGNIVIPIEYEITEKHENLIGVSKLNGNSNSFLGYVDIYGNKFFE